MPVERVLKIWIWSGSKAGSLLTLPSMPSQLNLSQLTRKRCPVRQGFYWAVANMASSDTGTSFLIWDTRCFSFQLFGNVLLHHPLMKKFNDVFLKASKLIAAVE